MDDSNFYSIDRLMEFGFGVAVATQMANSMNQGLHSMQIPGVDNSVKNGIPQASNGQGSISAIYYAVLDGKATGPFNLVDLARLANDKRITKETYIWKPGMNDWTLAENIKEVLQVIALTPPPIPSEK